MVAKRGRVCRGRKVKEQKSIGNLSCSLIDPIATSSPGKNILTEKQIEETCINKSKEIIDDYRKQFNTFFNQIEEELVNMNFYNFMNTLEQYLEDDVKSEPDSSVGVSGSSHVSKRTENDTQPSVSKISFKTPSASRIKPYSVIPCENTNKKVNIKRLPLAGETAVSLAGSPLLVTPFGSEADQVALTVTDSSSGKVVSILPDITSGDEDIGLLLDETAKTKVKEFAVLLNKISVKW